MCVVLVVIVVAVVGECDVSCDCRVCNGCMWC